MTPSLARFLTALVQCVTGTLLGVGAFLFSASTERWLGLGVGAAVLLLILVSSAIRGRGTLPRILDLIAALVGIWTMVSLRTVGLTINGATPHLVKWLGISSGAALVGLGLVLLIVHETLLGADLGWARDRLRERAGELAGARAETTAARLMLAETEAALAEAEAELPARREIGLDGPLTRLISPPRPGVPGPLTRARAAFTSHLDGDGR